MIPALAQPFAPSVTDAGRRNMELLLQLRWIAVGGQLATIGAVHWLMHIPLPMTDLLMACGMLVALNLASTVLLRGRERPVTNGELTVALLIDVATLTWQLHHSGGLSNPFSSLFLLQVAIGAIVLRAAYSWAIVAATLVALATLGLWSDPLPLPPPYDAERLRLYVEGNLVCFLLIAVLLVLFVTRINRNLSDRDAALATSRQRAAEEDHIVRMGLLASGAAHELGTPLSSLSVLIGDWKRMDRFADDTDMREDLEDMEVAVKRCKTIVGGILLSAGEARGVAPEFTTVRGFITGLVTEWSAIRLPGTIHLNDLFGEDVPIISDLALRQVIANVIDNALDVSPRWVGITARRVDERLVLDIIDNGPGFSAEILHAFGQPYLSTKGKPGGGLGLFLLVNVVRKLGGAAEAINREGGGALVRIVLPLATLAYHKETRG
jgi:two-component system sensor histidine kinase RegB